MHIFVRLGWLLENFARVGKLLSLVIKIIKRKLKYSSEAVKFSRAWHKFIFNVDLCFIIRINLQTLSFYSFYLLVSVHTMHGETLIIVQVFDFQFLADLHILVSEESKKHKINMVFGCLLVS